MATSQQLHDIWHGARQTIADNIRAFDSGFADLYEAGNPMALRTVDVAMSAAKATYGCTHAGSLAAMLALHMYANINNSILVRPDGRTIYLDMADMIRQPFLTK